MKVKFGKHVKDGSMHLATPLPHPISWVIRTFEKGYSDIKIYKKLMVYRDQTDLNIAHRQTDLNIAHCPTNGHSP